MKKNKITIHHIAKELGIDSSTVSRALNNSSRVTQKTKTKIFEKADELGYQPNLLAANFRKSVTNTIGVIVPRISRHFFSSVIQGIEETAYELGYSVIICQSLEQFEREQKIVHNLIANRVDGVLLSISMDTKEYVHIKDLEKNEIPFVFFDRHINSIESNKILIDDYKGALDATQHLIDQGCRRIIHLSGPQNLEIYKNRFEGYKTALKNNNITFNESFVFSSRLMEKDGFEIIKKLIENHIKFDGIFSANDVAAIGAINFLNSKKIKIPEDVSIVGFSNEPISRVINPSLTTIHQPGLEMGKIATDLLMESIKNKINKPQTIILDTNLIVRSSSKRKITKVNQ